METRLRFAVVFVGALLVIATFTYPLWRPAQETPEVEEGFPDLDEELLGEFSLLPESIQQAYLQMRQQNALMAADLVEARLRPPDPIPPEDQEPPSFAAATTEASGEFGPLVLNEDAADNTDRQLPPFSRIYSSAGQVTIYQFPNNRKFMWIEDLQVVNGPDLHVLLSTSEMPFNADELGRDYIDLGPLVNPAGSQGYDIPTEIRLGNYRSVVIYDITHRIVFSVAPL